MLTRRRPGFWRLQMSDSNSDDLETRRRKLRYRAWHRGTREMDLLFGRFVDAELEGFSEDEIAELEHLVELPDPDLLAWLMGEREVPAANDTPMFRRIMRFHREGRGLAAR
jgi:antitoxin CptB